MALRNIVKKGDPSLYKKSREVTAFNARLHTLLDDMRETLEHANGAGLAAPQVGVLRRAVLVVDSSGDEDVYIELVNPRIVERDGEQEGLEGCLSIPGAWGIVKRPNHVRIQAQDRYGQPFEVEGEGFTARAFCHELDHLDGILYDELAERMLTAEEVEALLADQEDEEES